MTLKAMLFTLLFLFSSSLVVADKADRHHIPSLPQHELLNEFIREYEELERIGGWPVIDTTLTLREGDKNEAVVSLRRRLIASRHLPFDTSLSPLFTEELTSAVKDFQRLHGLAIDGIVGLQTRAELNVPVQNRIKTLQVNSERSKILAPQLGSYFLLVNIAGFELLLIKDGVLLLRSPVVVGKPYFKTPLFQDLVRYIEFYPSWHVPKSIFQNELVPAIKRDRKYLAAQHFVLYREHSGKRSRIDPNSIEWDNLSQGQLRQLSLEQRPGSWNALGFIKFGFPNTYDVYLHDTPARALFQQPIRAFSHGCIRVQKASELAELLLANDNLEPNSNVVESMLKAGRNKRVYLNTPVPISITYRTAWVDLDGTLHFRKDIYGRDSLSLQSKENS